MTLKLYVWREFAPDYYEGLAVAIAHSESEARRLIVEAMKYNPSDWGPCQEHELDVPFGIGVMGGG